MKPFDTEKKSASPFARLLRSLVRPRYRAQLTEPGAASARKLEPIAEVLARTGREQGSAD